MYVVDEKGEKMSKSLGNIVDPQEVLRKYGAEAFRIWTFLEGDISHGDIRCSFKRIEGTSKFLTKLWNIARFISSFPTVNRTRLTKTDKWILGEISNLIRKVRKKYDQYSFHGAATIIREFVWDIFASHYVEMVKSRAYGRGFNKEEQKAACFTLHTCMRIILKLLAPMIPFMTDYIWRKMYGKKSIHLQEFPKARWRVNLTKLTPELIEFNSMVWNTKRKKGLSLKDSIKIKIPKKLRIFEKDLIAMHNIRTI
jgi:valyl-tRNA synthetase